MRHVGREAVPIPSEYAASHPIPTCSPTLRLFSVSSGSATEGSWTNSQDKRVHDFSLQLLSPRKGKGVCIFYSYTMPFQKSAHTPAGAVSAFTYQYTPSPLTPSDSKCLEVPVSEGRERPKDVIAIPVPEEITKVSGTKDWKCVPTCLPVCVFLSECLYVCV